MRGPRALWADRTAEAHRRRWAEALAAEGLTVGDADQYMLYQCQRHEGVLHSPEQWRRMQGVEERFDRILRQLSWIA